ncbi:putative 3 -cyclic-nucleotide phosphodiesterase [Erysiphe necator]|uniref:Putative 3-cyclic-nucleotide phosphodiesterase n=1 Tax=Uncinula necator TaxID=52586 RepID=A0A0B1P2A5_UNCNE|nr:putative 3 -cyclic-nucleotide phosphodiesterase [Erysiphe necator]
MASYEKGFALQVIILGTGGGPFENNTTAFLVRSVAKKWCQGSLLAVDAGVHLAAISKILESSGCFHKNENIENEVELSNISGQPLPVICSGPFEGLELQHRSLKANAGYIAGVLVETYIITHPHLDHISGLVVNSSGLTGIKPKKIAALPPTICALKKHIFNNVIWPNLTNENNGAGLISFKRLAETRSSTVNSNDGKDFTEICEGLQVNAWGVSHGRCSDKHEIGVVATETLSPDELLYQNSSTPGHLREDRTTKNPNTHERIGVYESSAFFIRDIATGTQILIFGDVEPDSISSCPRNKYVWSEAAPKIVAGELRGIFIECSYDDTRAVDILFGHLAPRYLIEEIKVLATEVEIIRNVNQKILKHEDNINSFYDNPRLNATYGYGFADTECAEMVDHTKDEHNNDGELLFPNSKTSESLPNNKLNEAHLPLKGVKIIIIHTKDNLDDSPQVANIIHQQLLEHEKKAQLGCEFIISRSGQSWHF